MRRFFSDESGGYAIMTAVLAVPLMYGVGLVVDFGRASDARASLQDSLDAAVLAGVSVIGQGDQKAISTARTYFAANDALLDGLADAEGQPLEPAFVPKDGTLSAKVTYSMPTTFMKLAHIDSVPVTVSASASAAGLGIELALVVDVSSSMEDHDKIQDLRDAAVALIDSIYGSSETRANTWVAVVPFDGRVNVSSYSGDWIDMSLKPQKADANANCTGLRSPANRINDELPKVEKFPPYLIGKNYGDSYTCGGPKAVGLTAEKAPVRNMLARLKTGYGTSVWEGVAWGFRMLSPKWKGMWGNPALPLSYEESPRKVMIVMTDGENTPGDYGDPFGRQVANQMEVAACADMKTQGITIYTVAFDITKSAAQPLKECASSDGHYFHSSKSADLIAAFDKIGSDLARGEARLLY